MRGGTDILSRELAHEVAERVARAGIDSVEVGISSLAYVPEFVQAMIQRFQAGRVSRCVKKKWGKAARMQILLRLNPAVHAALAQWAADDLRSVNAQIEVRLRRALSEVGRASMLLPCVGAGDTVRTRLSDTFIYGRR